ncbi:MAG: exonuclease subunit SbcD, partial [Wenzhouxiangella sp.]
MKSRKLKIIHTSDWHLGQVFHAYERTGEHQKFLDWLLSELKTRQPDALLIAGDIFEHANPSGRAQTMFYAFLSHARKACPSMDMAIIAGNHDSAARLEAPNPILSGLGIHVVGQLDGDEAPGRSLIPLHHADGTVGAWCLGVPFLRAGDVPRSDGEGDPYPRGIAETYRRHVDAALGKRDKNQALIAMGHLHAQVEELAGRYGPVDIFWWDYSAIDFQGEEAWRAFELIENVRARQPRVVMNNRLFLKPEAGWRT